jgi:hypothetical protein
LGRYIAGKGRLVGKGGVVTEKLRIWVDDVGNVGMACNCCARLYGKFRQLVVSSIHC